MHSSKLVGFFVFKNSKMVFSVSYCWPEDFRVST
jgi:hypothetical protein